MGIIQNAINQALGTAGLAARLSPGYETRVAKHEAKKEAAKIQNITEGIHKDIGFDKPEEKLKAELNLNLPERRIELAKKEAETGLRTPENASRIIEQQKIQKEITEGLDAKKFKINTNVDLSQFKTRSKQAMQKVADIQEEKLNQRQVFKKYPDDLKRTINILKGRDV